jgi:uncharacterized membrane protein YhaH (DUF805 family)
MNCPQCGIDNPEGALFCGGCGTSLGGYTEAGIGAASPELPVVSFPQAIKLGFENYFLFSGRSTRAEYWWWVLFATGTSVILSILGAIVPLPLQGIFGLITLIPGLALGARRLHDINRTGWWQLMWLGFFLIIPVIVLIVWAIRQGDASPNKYGSDPRRATSQPPYTPL